MDEEKWNSFIASLNPEQKQQYDALGVGKGGGKGNMEAGPNNMATIQGMPNIGNYASQQLGDFNQGNQSNNAINDIENTANDIEQGMQKYKEASAEGGSEDKLKNLTNSLGLTSVDSSTEAAGVKDVGDAGGGTSAGEMPGGTDLGGGEVDGAMDFIKPVLGTMDDNPVQQDTGVLFEESDRKAIQGVGGIITDSAITGGETFAKTGNPYAAAFAAVVTTFSGMETRKSGMRLKEKIDAQTKFMNAHADHGL